MSLGTGRGVAVREFVLQKPDRPPDYLLYVDQKPVGGVEAMPEGTTLTEVERQSSRYSEGLPERITPRVLPCLSSTSPQGRRHRSPTSATPSRGAGSCSRSTAMPR